MTIVCVIVDFQMSLKDLVMPNGSLIWMRWNQPVGTILPLEEVQFLGNHLSKLTLLGPLWRPSLL